MKRLVESLDGRLDGFGLAVARSTDKEYQPGRSRVCLRDTASPVSKAKEKVRLENGLARAPAAGIEHAPNAAPAVARPVKQASWIERLALALLGAIHVGGYFDDRRAS